MQEKYKEICRRCEENYRYSSQEHLEPGQRYLKIY